MPDLQSFHARVCWTAAGMLVHDHKVLLVKHKKLGLWLAPGGHVEAGEAPHQTAEREFWEEAGIRVKAYDVMPAAHRMADVNEILPLPFQSDLHWISKENYEARLASKHPEEPHVTAKWPRGCEQHLGFIFLVKPVDVTQLDFKQNEEESDGIGWFSREEVGELHTTQSIRHEVYYALELAHSTSHG